MHIDICIFIMRPETTSMLLLEVKSSIKAETGIKLLKINQLIKLIKKILKYVPKIRKEYTITKFNFVNKISINIQNTYIIHNIYCQYCLFVCFSLKLFFLQFGSTSGFCTHLYEKMSIFFYLFP